MPILELKNLSSISPNKILSFQKFLAMVKKGKVTELRDTYYYEATWLNAIDRNGLGALHIACQQKNKAMVEYLLAEGSCIFLESAEKYYPIEYVVRNNDIVLFDYFLTRSTFKALLPRQSKPAQNLLVFAAEWGAIDIVKELVDKYKWNVNGQNDKGTTAMTAIVSSSRLDTQNKRVKTLKFLVGKKGKFGEYERPLLIALKNGQSKIVKYLVEAGVRPNATEEKYAKEQYNYNTRHKVVKYIENYHKYDQRDLAVQKILKMNGSLPDEKIGTYLSLVFQVFMPEPHAIWSKTTLQPEVLKIVQEMHSHFAANPSLSANEALVYLQMKRQEIKNNVKKFDHMSDFNGVCLKIKEMLQERIDQEYGNNQEMNPKSSPRFFPAAAPHHSTVPTPSNYSTKMTTLTSTSTDTEIELQPIAATSTSTCTFTQKHT